MLNSVTCPNCSRQVSLPVGGQGSTWVRCPLCRGEYQLQEAFDYVPPALEVILKPHSARASSAPYDAHHFANVARPQPLQDQTIPDLLVNPELQGNAPTEFALAPELPPQARSAGLTSPVGTAPALQTFATSTNEVVMSAADEFSDELQLAPELPRPAGRAPARAAGLAKHAPQVAVPPVPGQAAGFMPGVTQWPTSRPVKRRRNPVVEMVKIIVAGMAGLVIAYAVLIWGFKVDPFGLSKHLPPAILPEQLKTPDDANS
jgi:hypothetical protein